VHLKVQTAWLSLGLALKSPWLGHFCPLALYGTHFRRGSFFPSLDKQLPAESRDYSVIQAANLH